MTIWVIESLDHSSQHGGIRKRNMSAGVPQDSVLGPLLWNVAYDEVLRMPLLKDCTVIGYADDTFILVTTQDVRNAELKANLQTAGVLLRIRALRATVAEAKTDVIMFHGKNPPRRIPKIVVGIHTITPVPTIKYLSIYLDSRMTFKRYVFFILRKKYIEFLGHLAV